MSTATGSTPAAPPGLDAPAAGSTEGSRLQAERRSLRAARWTGVALVAAAALLYLVTLDTGLQPGELVGGDLITHQYAQVQARPGNAPGYPLYTMGGWLWFHALRPAARWLSGPLPNPMPLLSSYSTLWALLALWLLYTLICRLTRGPAAPAGHWPLAFLLSAFYAVTYFFWYYATTTEQYSSAIAQTLAIVYVYLLWRDEATAGRPQNGHLYLLAFLCGLSLAHMLTVALIVPPLVAVVLWQAPRLLRSPRALAGAVAAAALPLASYLYVYLRGAAHPEWWGAGDWPSAGAWFWSFVSTAQGRDELSWGLEAGRAFLGNGFPELMWQELSIPLFALGLVGIALFDRRLATLLYGTVGLTLLFCWFYRYGNWYQVALPIYPLLLLGAARAIQAGVAALDRERAGGQGRSPGWAGAAAGVLLLAAVGWRAAASWPAADSSHRTGDTALDRAALLLDQPLPQGAALFAAVDDALALQYLIQIWGVRPDLAVASSAETGLRLAAGELVLATWDAAGALSAELPADLHVARQSAGPDWILFSPAGERPEGALWPPAIPFDGSAGPVYLAGYGVAPAPSGAPLLAAARTAQEARDVTLYWQLGPQGWPDGLAISLRPTQGGAFIPDPDRPDAVLQQDSPGPARGLLAQPPGAAQTVADAYRLPWPAGTDGLFLILYRHTAGGIENVDELPLPLP